LISQGRAEIVAGRGSFVDSFPLFGFRLEDYDALFSEKLDLLLRIPEDTHVRWSGKYRATLTGQAVYPRPLQNPLPIWVGVGGTPASFVRAGEFGLPLAVAIIGGEPRRFRPLIDLYRETGRRAGHGPEKLMVGLHAIGFLGDTTQRAADDFYPLYAYSFTEIGKERGWPPNDAGAIRRGVRSHRCVDHRRSRKGRGENTLRERSPWRPHSHYVSNGRVSAPASEDVAVD
jgi:alkanesulfonate monooxygenase SsuD/methylene tetrahydromethanopterin reductase-like flavin-dependent oxidoreductase (luciferase family)